MFITHSLLNLFHNTFCENHLWRVRCQYPVSAEGYLPRHRHYTIYELSQKINGAVFKLPYYFFAIVLVSF